MSRRGATWIGVFVISWYGRDLQKSSAAPPARTATKRLRFGLVTCLCRNCLVGLQILTRCVRDATQGRPAHQQPHVSLRAAKASKNASNTPVKRAEQKEATPPARISGPER